MLSLRQRLTRQAAWAILALVLGFGSVTWIVTAVHLYAVSRAQAVNVAVRLLNTPHLDRRPKKLNHYNSATRPEIWVDTVQSHWRSPNATTKTPPPPGLNGLTGSQPTLVVRVTRPSVGVTVAWPFLPVLDVLRDLMAVLALLGFLAGAVGAWLARWATQRMLVPVDRMTRAVAHMVAQHQVAALPVWSDSDDEFNRLSMVFNQLLEELRQQSNRERQMLAQAAHELRTPLQVLQGNLDILADWGGLDPTVRQESLAQGRQVLDRLNRMVGDLMTLERASSNDEPDQTYIWLGPLIDTLALDARALAPQLKVVTETRPASIFASEWSVERALWAVLDNALKYTPPGGQIRLATVLRAHEAGVVIEDTGPGILESELPRVFDRFFRGAPGRQHLGSGLGLAIAKALVEHQNGRIHLVSQPGQGTRVELWWPRSTSSGPRSTGT